MGFGSRSALQRRGQAVSSAPATRGITFAFSRVHHANFKIVAYMMSDPTTLSRLMQNVTIVRVTVVAAWLATAALLSLLAFILSGKFS